MSGSNEHKLAPVPLIAVQGLVNAYSWDDHQAQNLDQWRRLNICAAEDCRWAFYDTSKNRGGTWCRMEVCGNRTKNRRYRSKN